MTKLIAIDDGHGMETAGKRTPKFSDGSIMHENEFNSRVAQLLAVHLIRCGYDVIMVAPSDKDIPLKVRTDTANKAKADLYISIHTNAMTGYWGAARGIETFHYTKASENSKRAARIIHKHLLTGARLADRGVKAADFHVLRETIMPAVLVECGFMDNIEEAQLLITEEYRVECALELAKGICEYLGDPFLVEKSASRFNDIDKHWAKEYIEKAVSAGILSGRSDGTFDPDQSVTRAELAVVVAKIIEK